MQYKERPWYRLYQFLLSMIYSSVFMLYFNIFGRTLTQMSICVPIEIESSSLFLL